MKKIFKSLLKPENAIRITDVITDGDSSPIKIAESLVWDADDGVADVLVGQKVVKNKPRLHRGQLRLPLLVGGVCRC